MKSSLLMLALLALGTITGAIVHQVNAHGQQPAEAEKGRLKGEWMMVSVESYGTVAEIFGQVPEPDKIKTATFADDSLKVTIDGHSIRATYLLDPTTTPKRLDLTFTLRGNKKATCQSIYELEGNHLKMCLGDFGDARPTAFPPKPKDPAENQGRFTVLVLRRIGADPKLDALDRNQAKSARKLRDLANIMYGHVQLERSYPPAAIYGKDGQPLLSWRVALLGRMGEEKLLKEFKTDEPWDSTHNKKLLGKMPAIYALPGVETKEPGMTFYQTFTGKGTIFEDKHDLKFTDHLKSDGPHFLIVEAGEPVPWTKPDDLPYDPTKPLPKLGRLSDEGFHAAFTFLAGDAVLFIPKSTPEGKLRSLIQWRAIDEKENKKGEKP